MYLLIMATAENLGLNPTVNTHKLFKQKKKVPSKLSFEKYLSLGITILKIIKCSGGADQPRNNFINCK